MSIDQFTAALQSKVYKDWLEKLDKNIITASSEKLRAKEQTAAKTSFYITKDTVEDIFFTITGKKIASEEVQLFMQELVMPLSGKTGSIQGKKISVNGRPAVFFESIGFDTISTKINEILLDVSPEVEEAFLTATQKYYEQELPNLKASAEYKKATGSGKQKLLDALEKKAKAERGTFGGYFNKGHVIGVATNLAKQFREDLETLIKTAEDKALKEQKVLLEVLDKYIAKLEKDDLATANLPDAVNQELYAGYIKSRNKYLVEIQHRVGNIEAGSAAQPIIKELREIFSVSAKDLEAIVKNSPGLGEALLTTKGSPSYLDILSQDIADTLAGKQLSTKVYVEKPKLVSKKVNKIQKESNKKKIEVAKKLRNSLSKQTKKVPLPDTTSQVSLTALQNLINANLAAQIEKNMGTGSRRDVLNYRTGRLAESAKVEKLSESRAGMITAFYTYMRNPYGTFSAGGAQSVPTSRDPKLLISKSIREIAATQVANRMRAVLA